MAWLTNLIMTIVPLGTDMCNSTPGVSYRRPTWALVTPEPHEF